MMKRKLLALSITLWISLSISTFVSTAEEENSVSWIPLPGSFRLTPAFPDKCSSYNILTFEPKTGDFDMMKLHGEFPHARYFSYTIYDSNEGTDLAAFLDQEIQPDPGSINPFKVGVDRNAKNRSYTLWLVKDGVSPPNEANSMIIPPDVEILVLGMRVYRPDRGADPLGNVSLPKVEFLKEDLTPGIRPKVGLDRSGILNKISMFLFNKELIESWKIGRDFTEDEIAFYRVSDEGLFPNAHNEYIISILPQFYFNKVAVITFTPPTFEYSYAGEEFKGGKNVRYWSICTGGLGMTATPDCLCDDEIKLNSDGTVTICIAPWFMKKIIENAGFNYMKWGMTYKPLLIYRQMLANESFDGSIHNVPKIGRPPVPENRNKEFFNENRAVNFIGEYCPQGNIYSILEFISWLNSSKSKLYYKMGFIGTAAYMG